jgi:protease IV
MMLLKKRLLGFMALLLLLGGCIQPKIGIFPDSSEPLEEFTLQGTDEEKILVVSIKGMFSDSPRDSFLRSKPSVVQEVVSQLNKAEKDKAIKALLLKVDSPGGTVTASDLLYHEIMRYKERSGAKVVAQLMGVAASGGYYVALPADVIVAHPTTVTGSIGVIFINPKVAGLMKKIGMDVEVDKSGKNKDMGSPFRESTDEERRISQSLIDGLAGRFHRLVASHRSLESVGLEKVASARVYLADEALKLGLVDQLGYMDDAIERAKYLAELPKEPRVVVYRRTEYAEDNLYNDSSAAKSEGSVVKLIDLGMLERLNSLPTGFYYLWLPGAAGE